MKLGYRLLRDIESLAVTKGSVIARLFFSVIARSVSDEGISFR